MLLTPVMGLKRSIFKGATPSKHLFSYYLSLGPSHDLQRNRDDAVGEARVE